MASLVYSKQAKNTPSLNPDLNAKPLGKHKQKHQMYSLIPEFEIEVVHSPAFPQSLNEK